MYECLDCWAEFTVSANDDEGNEICPACGSDDILCDVGDEDDLLGDADDYYNL